VESNPGFDGGDEGYCSNLQALEMVDFKLFYIITLLFVSPFAQIYAEEQQRPNIIFILADDLGIGDVGAYGQRQIKTPHIDQLAKEGMLFTDFYAGSTVCAPSRCSLMTGRHTGRSIIRNNSGERVYLKKETPTISKVLREVGYRNGTIGKWGLGLLGTPGEPLEQGMDHFYGYVDQRHAHNFYPEFIYQNRDRVALRNVVPNAGPQGQGVASIKIDYTHHLFAEEALRFVSVEREEPFFLYLAFTLPHANNEMTKETGEGNEIPSDAPYSREDWPQTEKNKAAMITLLDRDIGRLMEKLKALGIDDQTLVMFSSDNGPHAEGGNDPDFFQSSGRHQGIKRDLYDGGIRVPMIARWPGKIAAGSQSDELFAFWDVLPTLADVAGADIPAETDGLSFLPTLLSERQDQRHSYLYWEFSARGSGQAIRMGKWKAIRNGLMKNPEPQIKLFDITKDPMEQNDLASSMPEIVEQARKAMVEAHVRSPEFPLGTWEGKSTLPSLKKKNKGKKK
jgi:arylsulfatase A-like enzyme